MDKGGDYSMKFPQRGVGQWKGAKGETFFQFFVNDFLGCIYHPIDQKNDFGIDGYIELVNEGHVTGKLIGIQLKYGDSYFRHRTVGGFKFIGENKHLNYYMNNEAPIFIILIDDLFEKMHWVLFNIAKTLQAQGENWWIEVPIINDLRINFKKAMFDTVSPILDFEEQIKKNWFIDKIIEKSNLRVIAIPKEEIIQGKFDFVINFIERLSKNKEILLNTHSSLDIYFPEYDKDEREIFQISEIMKWLKGSIDFGVPWFYFLDIYDKSVGLKLLFHSYCSANNFQKSEKGYYIEYDKYGERKFYEQNFINMNSFMDKNNLSLELNIKITDLIVEYFEKQKILAELNRF